MTTTEDITDATLHHMGRTGLRPFLVVIGAMDGVSEDELAGYSNLYGWSGLYVEPIPEQFRRLQRNHAALAHPAANLYENSAVAAHDGTTRMLSIRQEAVDDGRVASCFGGMSAIHPPRNGLSSAADAATVAQYGEIVEVNCVTLATLFTRHAVERVDVFCVDAEGWDFEVLRQLDFAAHRPKLIRCEYVNLRPEEQAAIVELLERYGYVVRVAGQNVDGVAAEYWREVDAARRSRPVPAARDTPAGRMTLVTSVFDPSRGAADLRLRRAFGRDLDRFKRLLQVDWPMVVFVPPALAELVRRSRPSPHTYVVEMSSDPSRAFPFRRQLETTYRRREATPGGGTDEPPVSVPLALSKQFFLNDAAIYDPFKTEYFLWVDGDIAADIGDPRRQFTGECRRHLAEVLGDGRMLYVACPFEAASDPPGFGRAAMTAFAGREPAYLVSGRLFGGAGRAVHAINAAYYGCLGATLDAGQLGTERQVLTIASHTHAHLCDVHVLPSARPVRTFLERLQHGAPPGRAAWEGGAP